MTKLEGSKGKLSANLTKVEAKDAKPIPPAKTGIEVMREKFQAHADEVAVDRVVVHNHDTGAVLFNGSPMEYKRWKADVQKLLDEEG